MNKIAKYILNPDGTIPSFVISGGYFSVKNDNEPPQDWTIVGVVEDHPGLESFLDLDSLVNYLESIGGLEWVDIQGNLIDLYKEASFLWNLMLDLDAE